MMGYVFGKKKATQVAHSSVFLPLFLSLPLSFFASFFLTFFLIIMLVALSLLCANPSTL